MDQLLTSDNLKLHSEVLQKQGVRKLPYIYSSAVLKRAPGVQPQTPVSLVKLIVTAVQA